MVKALDLSSNGRMSAWVRTPPVLDVKLTFKHAKIVTDVMADQKVIKMKFTQAIHHEVIS